MDATAARRRPGDAARWAILIGGGLLARLLAAWAVQGWTDARGTLCVFPDADIYWLLGRRLAEGASYRVDQWGVPHYALRTPGYPLFLAACQRLFGPSTWAARVVQAGLGASCVILVHRLAARVAPAAPAAPWIAATLAAFDPYTVGLSALLLSEAVFLPLLLLGLWGLAALWDAPRARLWPGMALGTGLAWGAAIQVKPSWALGPPLMLVLWMALARHARRRAVAGALLVLLGTTVVLAPWWARNARVFGRFVPTALWMGASLYDGLNPAATGASDMRFLADPAFRPLSEPAQDAALTAAALRFVRDQPARALELAAIKAARFWSPWPQAESLRGEGTRSLLVVLAFAIVVVPQYLLLAAGAIHLRRDSRALVLSLAPLLYFAAIHMVFASSVRYRLPAIVAAFPLMAAGLGLVTRGDER